jgi:hypothetical protein
MMRDDFHELRMLAAIMAAVLAVGIVAAVVLVVLA